MIFSLQNDSAFSKVRSNGSIYVLTVLYISSKPVQNQRHILNGQLRNYVCGNLFKKGTINAEFLSADLRISLVTSIVSFLLFRSAYLLKLLNPL